MENHNSVLGIREYALSQGAAAFAVDIEEADNLDNAFENKFSSLRVTQYPIQRRKEAIFVEKEPTGKTYNLFAFPSECNFSGVRFSPELVNIIKEDTHKILEGSPFNKGCWMLLIDAAKGCTTEPPNLSKYPADFVVMSFYKLFGYPTGLGALIVRNEASKLLKKTYFSGGTVAASIADIDFIKRREGFEESFEDGTTSFLGIASIRHGFKILNELTVSAIFRHMISLSRYVREILLGLCHGNGTQVCTLYGCHESKSRFLKLGSIVSFNLRRPDGSWFGYHEVEKLASLSGIQLRTGCFCNPGACAKYLGLSHLDILSNVEAGHICWDDYDIINGKPTGAVRVSFGYMSTFEDAKKFIDFIINSFVSLPHQSGHVNMLREGYTPFLGIGGIFSTGCHLKSIYIYPIKSCSGFFAETWPLSCTGLQHDREWVLRSPDGEILTQKKVPEMHLISTFIDLNQGMLFVESSRCNGRLIIDLKLDSYYAKKEEMVIHTKRYSVQGYGYEVDAWFSRATRRPCSLFRCFSSDFYYCSDKNKAESMCGDVESRLNFVNEGQLLLISEESVSDLNKRQIMNAQKGSCGVPVQVNAMRFRPNLVISGGEPYAEDEWKHLKIGSNRFMSLGGCNRCQMINIEQQREEVHKSKEPLATLASYRRVKGKILFGVLLKRENGNNVEEDTNSHLQVGQEVHVIQG